MMIMVMLIIIAINNVPGSAPKVYRNRRTHLSKKPRNDIMTTKEKDKI